MSMKKRIKFTVILGAVMMLSGFTMSVSAADNNDPYQEVIDKLNEEYSMDIHFISSAERSNITLYEKNEIDVSPEEFEADLRQEIIENNRAKAEADEKFKELESKKIDESGSGICSQANTSDETRTTKSVERSKKVAGATVHLKASVSNAPGYWKYSSVCESLFKNRKRNC